MESITAISTPAGTGGLAIVRLSGDDAFKIADKVWKGATLSKAPSHTAHLGEIIDEEGNMLDQCIATIFHKDRSFTGEPTVEFSIHGSEWLQREVVALLIRHGASPAGPGEFSRRAFINGRLDLTQAEAIADMISASSATAIKIAGNQLKGGFSKRLQNLRDNMITLASLLELELDFSEEDVEFADRKKLLDICDATLPEISRLADSFRTGRAIKEGVTVVIAGIPNAGKSTLLNQLLQEDKAIVSDIPGTTRDIIDDSAEINGILYRFYDTAGLRQTTDPVEQIGINKARNQISKSDIILMLLDPMGDPAPQLQELAKIREITNPDTVILTIINKSDLSPTPDQTSHLSPNEDTSQTFSDEDTSQAYYTFDFSSLFSPSIDTREKQEMYAFDEYTSENEEKITTAVDITSLNDNSEKVVRISAKTGTGIDKLIAAMEKSLNINKDINSETLITNIRHYQQLELTREALIRVKEALKINLPADLIAQDLRQAIHHIGSITGQITTDTLLQTIFTRFCIGK